jgi:hypothetical protein
MNGIYQGKEVGGRLKRRWVRGVVDDELEMYAAEV